jgi:hypothetical protein
MTLDRGRTKRTPQISPLRCAPVEMTILFEHSIPRQGRGEAQSTVCLFLSPSPWPTKERVRTRRPCRFESAANWPQPYPLSSRAKPRDLRFRGPLVETRNTILKQNCHLDRSVAKWRDLRFSLSAHALSPAALAFFRKVN